MRDDRANADNLLDALMVAQKKLTKIAALCNDELLWNEGAVNPEVFFFAEDIRAVLNGTDE